MHPGPSNTCASPEPQPLWCPPLIPTVQRRSVKSSLVCAGLQVPFLCSLLSYVLLLQTLSSPPSLSSDPHGSWTAFSLDLKVGICSQLWRAQHNPDVYETQRCPKSRLGLSHDNPSLTCCFLLACSLGLPPRCVPQQQRVFSMLAAPQRFPELLWAGFVWAMTPHVTPSWPYNHPHVCVFTHLLMECALPPVKGNGNIWQWHRMSGCRGLRVREMAGGANLGPDGNGGGPRLGTFAKLKNSKLLSRESIQFMPQLSDKVDTRAVVKPWDTGKEITSHCRAEWPQLNLSSSSPLSVFKFGELASHSESSPFRK